MIAPTCVQDEFLETLVKEQTAVNVFLVNGIRLGGQVSAYDHYTVMLKSGPSLQVVFKHAISTVLPANGSVAR
jgi:host factor-I protein